MAGVQGVVEWVEGASLCTIAEWALQDAKEAPWTAIQKASECMTYAVHGRDGLAHFVFSDGSVLVSHRWGQEMFAVDPYDDASWRGYRFRMEVWGMNDQVLTALSGDAMQQMHQEAKARKRRQHRELEQQISATRQ